MFLEIFWRVDVLKKLWKLSSKNKRAPRDSFFTNLLLDHLGMLASKTTLE